MSEVIEAEATIIDEGLSPLAGAELWLAEKRARVAEEAAKFSAYEVTDADSYKQAKRERGILNKSVRAINAERIDLMKGLRAAMDAFKAGTDEVTRPLEDVSRALDAECKRWERDVIEARREMLRGAYEDMAPDIALPQEGAEAPLVPFELLLERFGQGQLGKRWLLFGTNDEVARGQLAEAVTKVAEGERTVDAMVAEEDRGTVKALYLSTLDMDAAMARARELAEMRAAMARLEQERREREAERQAREEERRRAEAERAAEQRRQEAAFHAAEVRAAREKAEADYAAGYRTGVVERAREGVVIPAPAPDGPPDTTREVRHEVLAGLAGKARVTLVFEQPLTELVLDVSPQELELFRRILRFNNVRGVIRGLRRQ